ncbi:hypothetical protein T05_2495 [Trichinella murrelli]|uniref:Uncharacterized protein n=1 Tax=Trichinella murrelli TaxID=144512 RepID=A0A0V0T1T3_9BILA|nr:hypothetical protein T05_2495 [Trichinella murrelli]
MEIVLGGTVRVQHTVLWVKGLSHQFLLGWVFMRSHGCTPDPVAKKGEHVSPKHTIPRPSRDIYLRIRPLHGFGSMYASSQCPPATLLPVRRRAPNRSVCMEVPAERSTKFFRSALSCRIQQGTFVLRLLPCSPCRVGDTRSASVADALVPFQPSRVYTRLTLSLPARRRLNALSRRMACLKLTGTTGNPRTFPSSLQIPGGQRLQGDFHCLDFPESSQRCIRQFIYFHQEDPCLRGRAHPVM